MSRSKIIGAAFAALLATGTPAGAEPPERVTSLVVYGEDPCPKGEDDEIVVCARRPETERYRIPSKLREEGNPPSDTSNVTRMQALDEVSRYTMPNSCSVVGSGGQTGCFQQMMARWRAEREMDRERAYP